jgi:hypothetical protein
MLEFCEAYLSFTEHSFMKVCYRQERSMRRKPFSKSYHHSRAKCSAFNGRDLKSQLNAGAVGESKTCAVLHYFYIPFLLLQINLVALWHQVWHTVRSEDNLVCQWVSTCHSYDLQLYVTMEKIRFWEVNSRSATQEIFLPFLIIGSFTIRHINTLTQDLDVTYFNVISPTVHNFTDSVEKYMFFGGFRTFLHRCCFFSWIMLISDSV